MKTHFARSRPRCTAPATKTKSTVLLSFALCLLRQLFLLSVSPVAEMVLLKGQPPAIVFPLPGHPNFEP